MELESVILSDALICFMIGARDNQVSDEEGYVPQRRYWPRQHEQGKHVTRESPEHDWQRVWTHSEIVSL